MGTAMSRRCLRRLERIRTLDPERDYQEIYRLVARVEFRLEHRLGLLLAFWRAGAVPAIAELLDRTGETTLRAGKRADDTGLLMYELVDHGFGPGRGAQALRRINRIHARFPSITDEQYRYVLATMMVVPERFIDRYGWRPLCCHERAANFRYHRELGRRMNVRGFPATADDVAALFDEYERAEVRYSAAGARLMAATRDIVRGRVRPRPVAAAVRALSAALLDPHIRAATGTPEPSRATVRTLNALLAARRRVLWLSARPDRPVRPMRAASYPHGYEIDRLGPA
jgi:hypothetical protein